ncbi:histidine phosphatase family protein [Streptococcus sp. BJSWXB6CM1]|uniref:Histidine phosphatase family protein n=1 Tax=Streptococcus fermentans TaxID=3095082 RepID=A0ABU5FW22_9STRE|nr:MULTISPECIES: histidine phosphatase family protein [unclassified Streptococcus]MDY4345941.1 histidine phosphatase family protein [Streptococcus sp. BJSWXB5TM5]MDY4361049.1 histidine phosphatase family protein [Streptococcus sp. BJSWXB3CM3]MDY4371208.1 histidine phosphatase family protein [Streptococcus sp. BJSWXB6CM1]
MKIIFIRHGEPNYRELEERSYTGFGIDLAPLSEKGRQQAQELCKNPLFGSADILVSSAVTRALETAFYVSCATGLPLRVAPLLHEWQVYESGIDRFEEARHLFLENNGELLSNSPIQYETAEEMRSRFLESMGKYRDYQTVVVVTHRMLIRQFVKNEKIDFCQVIECELEI